MMHAPCKGVGAASAEVLRRGHQSLVGSAGDRNVRRNSIRMRLGKLSSLALAIIVGMAGWAAASAEEGATVWEFTTGGEISGSPAMDDSGNLFFGSRDGKIYSVSASGSLRWSYATADWVDSSPTLSPDGAAVYAGSWDNKLYALSASTGTLLWSFETGSLIAASPAVDAAGNIFFGSSDGFFYSLNSSGQLRWSFLVGTEMDSSPAVAADGSVYVGAFDGLLYAFTNDGVLKWSFATAAAADPADQRVKSPPTVAADGTIYFGGGNGHVYALGSDGVELWRFAALEAVDTGIAIGANGSLVFGSRDGYVYCLDSFGVLNWESYTGDVFYSTPAIDEFGRIYVGVYLGNGVNGVTVLSMDGDILWDSLALSYIDSSPLLGGNGLLYYGSYDGVFYAVEARAAAAESAWSRFGGGQANRSQQRPLAGPLAVSPEYTAWLQSHGLYGDTAAKGYDVDGDGWGVFLEYWLGGNPTTREASLVELVSSDGEMGAVSLQFNRPRNETILELGLLYSLDLAQWSLADAAQFGMVETIVMADAFGDGAYETVRLTLDFSGNSRLYLRAAAVLF